MSTSDASTCALVSTSEAKARHILDALAESFDSTHVVVAASEDRDGRWTVSLHFREAPDETAVRALIALAAGPEAANALVFETIGATDWVEASLQGLTPVVAGRFVVHGAHDRGRVPANRIGIEIEAALAFGTGHHGTTRGCLMALDRLAKRRPNGRGPPAAACSPLRPRGHCGGRRWRATTTRVRCAPRARMQGSTGRARWSRSSGPMASRRG